MSTTTNADRLCSYFGNCPVININEMCYPVTGKAINFFKFITITVTTLFEIKMLLIQCISISFHYRILFRGLYNPHWLSGMSALVTHSHNLDQFLWLN